MEREKRVQALLASAKRWAEAQPDIRALALVGSEARGSSTAESDVDLVVLTASRRYLVDTSWIATAAGEPGELLGTEQWGILTSQRVLVESGLEVEFGFAPIDWAATDPVDEGTAHVVASGLDQLYDPDGMLARLVGAVTTIER